MKKVIAVLPIILMLWVPVLVFSQVEQVNEKCLTANTFDDRYASYSPSGDKIVFESNRDGNWEIYIMDSNGMNAQRITYHTGDDRRPTWHPNGEKIIFESTRTGKNQLYILSLKESDIAQITHFFTGNPIFASFSPGGDLIALSLQESENTSNILLIDSKGNTIKKLTNNDKRNFYPKWSQDGSEIVYFSRKDTKNQDDEIYKLNIENSTESRLTDWPKHNFCPSWSEDNSKIAYVTSMEGTRPEIYIMDSNGENQIRITNNDDGDTLPNWSPDGYKILITGYRNGNFEICELTLK